MDMRCNEYEVVDICGAIALYSDERIDRRNVPDGVFLYDFRSGIENGVQEPFFALEEIVVCDYEGTIICNFPIDLDETGCHELSEEERPGFTGITMTIGEYLNPENGGLE